MTIDYISDIHLDNWMSEQNPQNKKYSKQLKSIIFDKILTNNHIASDVLVVAGDLSHYNQHTLFFLIEMKKIYDNIIVVSGNHDLYLASNNIQAKYKYNSLNRIEELKIICDNLNVYFLDGNVIEIDGIKFGGTCSWYNLPNNIDIENWNRIMNDSHYIMNNITINKYDYYYRTKTNSKWDTQKFWKLERVKLEKIIEKKCDVFITHVPLNEPTVKEGLNVEFENAVENIFYYTDNIEILKRSNCKIHIHGHTHQNLDYIKENIRIVCNPLGYSSDKLNNNIKTITI